MFRLLKILTGERTAFELPNDDAHFRKPARKAAGGCYVLFKENL